MRDEETKFERRKPSKAIVAFLRARLKDGRLFSTTRDISEGTGLSRRAVGTRMASMAKSEWHGLSISMWTETVWKVEIKHGCRGIRETV